MLTVDKLTSIVRARLDDADVLFSNDRLDGATYICGYAVEIALKARIVTTQGWSGFPASDEEFKDRKKFKTHNLQTLLGHSGREANVRVQFLTEWSIVVQWHPESRYRPPGDQTPKSANDMIDSAKKIIGALL